jgi:hypothetical protein
MVRDDARPLMRSKRSERIERARLLTMRADHKQMAGIAPGHLPISWINFLVNFQSSGSTRMIALP